jgi:hypothetical protein
MRRFYSGCAVVFAVGWLGVSSHVAAETNHPPAPPSVPDSERFFDAYSEAIRLLQEKKPQEAAVTMDQLCRQVTVSPWMEIALLKYTGMIEVKSSKAALENYQLLRSRVQNAPYFQGTAPYARVLTAAMTGATANGINRIRINRIRGALSAYFAKHGEYPESLAKLSVLGYIEMEDTYNLDGRTYQYTPTGLKLTPFISYKQYAPLECPPTEPFSVKTPILDGTSQISSDPPKYAALIKMSRKQEATRVIENQTVQGFLVCVVTAEGVILCSTDRILILSVSLPAR